MGTYDWEARNKITAERGEKSKYFLGEDGQLYHDSGYPSNTYILCDATTGRGLKNVEKTSVKRTSSSEVPIKTIKFRKDTFEEVSALLKELHSETLKPDVFERCAKMIEKMNTIWSS